MNVADDILIEKFLRNQLSDSEIIDFEKRLQEDNEFKKHFEFEKQLFQTLNNESWSFIKNNNADEVKEYSNLFKSTEIDDLKKTLKTVNYAYNNKIKKPFQKKWVYIVAASIALFFILNNFVFTSNSPQKLYAIYFKQTDLPSLVNRGNSKIELSKAQQLFNQKRYKEAIPIFETLINNNKPNSNLLIYLGISQMETNQYKNSLRTFDAIINDKSLITTKAYWFKALLYLKMNDIEKSKVILNKVKNEKLYNYDKAIKLLKALD